MCFLNFDLKKYGHLIYFIHVLVLFQLFCIQGQGWVQEKDLVGDWNPVHHLSNLLSLTEEMQHADTGTTSGKK
jgi:hypothetical protein